jgi:hypothetical protein
MADARAGDAWSDPADTGPAATWSATAGPARGDRARGDRARPDQARPTWRAAPAEPGDRRHRPQPDDGGGIDPFDPGPALSDLARLLLRDPVTPAWRLGLAAAGGAPLAIGLAWLLGELTGCGRFAATCDPGVVSFAWLAGLAIVAFLVLVPALASVTTVGSVTLFLAGVPATVLLSATGGARLPQASSAALGVILVLGWLAGVAYAAAHRRGRSSSRGPVS